MMRTALRMRPGRVINLVVLTVAALYFLFPLWWLLTASSKTQGQLVRDSAPWFAGELWQNLVTLFSRNGGQFWLWLLNGLIYAGVGAAVGTVLSAMAGYVFSKHNFRGREKAFGVVLAGVLVPPTVIALPLFLMFSAAGLTNTMLAVLLPSVVSPFGVYLARIQADAAVSDEILEAARCDGAGENRLFWSVAISLMRPGLVTLFLFQFAAIWNNFLLPLVMLSNDNLYPATLGLYSWSGLYIQDPTLVTSVVTGSFVAVIPTLIAFLTLERYLRQGVIAGGVKG